MSTDAEDSDESELVEVTVEMTKRQRDELEELWREAGYTSRSEFVREAIRDAGRPVLSRGALAELGQGFEDIEAGRTVSLEEAREQLGLGE